MDDSSSVHLKIKALRTRLTLSQSDLAHASGVSLPTIQNIERGIANPSLNTLQALGNCLGFTFTLTPIQADWDYLIYCGAPLLEQTPAHTFTFKIQTFLQCLKTASIELCTVETTKDRERKLDSLQALLLALQSHYPTFYSNQVLPLKIIPALQPKIITGKLIKLKRIALGRISKFL